MHFEEKLPISRYYTKPILYFFASLDPRKWKTLCNVRKIMKF